MLVYYSSGKENDWERELCACFHHKSFKELTCHHCGECISSGETIVILESCLYGEDGYVLHADCAKNSCKKAYSDGVNFIYRLYEATGFIGNTAVKDEYKTFVSLDEISDYNKSKHNTPYIRQLGPMKNSGVDFYDYGGIWLDYGSHSHFYVVIEEIVV